MFKKILTALMTVALLSGLTITLSACDTMAGFGQDVSSAFARVGSDNNFGMYQSATKSKARRTLPVNAK